MALTIPAGLNTDLIRSEVRSTYEQVARDPGGVYHFNLGPDYAVERLGYDRAEIDQLPRQATDSFAGVGNPFRMGQLREGQTVVDIGSGAGTDLLIAAGRVGTTGRAIGIDMTPAMRSLARNNARRAGLTARVAVQGGDAERLPLNAESADVVISNGVINLVSDKARAFREVLRILKPGGRLQLADVALLTAMNESERQNPRLWAG